MATANFQCPDCLEVQTITFKPGEIPYIICTKCKKPLKRVWKDISMVKVVDDTVLEAGQAMLRSGMTNKDKLVF